MTTIGDAKAFDNARRLTAWMGLVPRPHSTGVKAKLLGISKRIDSYFEILLIHGARSAILAARHKAIKVDGWLGKLLQRRNPNVVAVALANKNAHVVWALVAKAKQ